MFKVLALLLKVMPGQRCPHSEKHPALSPSSYLYFCPYFCKRALDVNSSYSRSTTRLFNVWTQARKPGLHAASIKHLQRRIQPRTAHFQNNVTIYPLFPKPCLLSWLWLHGNPLQLIFEMYSCSLMTTVMVLGRQGWQMFIRHSH